LVAAGCAGSAADAGEGPLDADAFSAQIDRALDEAYAALGKPAVDWDNMERVKDHAFAELTSDSVITPGNASWSLSVLDDHIAVYVNVDGDEKSFDWRP
jgi:hypothetical protein